MSENSEECFYFTANDFADTFSLYVRTLFESGDHYDSVIIGKNEGKVRAHRLILEATIPGLITLTDLQHDAGQEFGCNEANNSRSSMFVCKLPLTIETITKIVKYCYTGEISIAKDELVPLLKFAIDYNVKKLIGVCSNRLKQSIDPNNVKEIVEHWKKADNVLELRIWRQIICSNFLKVSKYPTFGDIRIDQFVNILRSTDLKSVREEEVFSAFLVWLENTDNTRALDLDIGKILSYIRYPLMNLKFFTENVEELLEKFNRNDLIAEYYKWQLIQRKQIGLKTEKCNERMSLRQNDLVVLNFNTNNNLEMQIVPPQPGKSITCREFAELQYNQFQSVTIMNDVELIISGGEDDHHNELSTVTGFNLETLEIMKYPALQIPRTSHASIVINSDIYVAGGCSGENTLNSVEKYCHINKKWSSVKLMNQSRMDFFLLAVNGNLYALGGRDIDGDPIFNSVERYDPSLDTWIEVSSMTYSRIGLSAVAHKHNNSIYVFGEAQEMRNGKTCLNFTDKVEQYNIGTNSWSTIYTMDTARMDIISCLYGEYIILVGGFDEEKDEDVQTIQVFDTERLECTYLNSLEEGVSSGVAFAAPMDLVEKLKEHPIRANI